MVKTIPLLPLYYHKIYVLSRGDNVKISEKLKNRRKQLGLTMYEVAQKAGVSEATVSRWESGDIANMKRDKIVLLAKALQVSPSFIMDWDNETEFFTIEETNLISNYRKLNIDGKAKADEYITDLSEQSKYTAAKTGTQNSISDEITPLFKQAVQTMTDIKLK